jgi:hypothetical protein
MLLAVVALASAASWVPMWWHSADPKSLELLEGTPVNCLLLEPEHWEPAFAAASRARRVAVLGIARSVDDVRRAKTMKFDALVLEGMSDARLSDAARRSGVPVIELPLRNRIRFDSGDKIVGTSQGLWPGVEAGHGGKSVTGPTSTPWINTNGGFLRFVRAATDSVVWIGVRPPRGSIFKPERYVQAIADAALVGARWIVALDGDLESRLLARDPPALRDWRSIAAALSYFEEHPEWRDYRAYSRMAVIQSAATGGLLSGSLLDMLASQRSTVRVVPPNRLTGESLKDTRVVLDVDPDSLSPEQRRAIDEFVKAGGLLINPPARWRFPQTSDDQILLERRQAGQLQSLWEVTYNATVRKNFGARTFNTTGILSSVLAAPDGKSVIVHLANYLDFPGEAITVHVLGNWTRARLYRPGAAPVDLPVFGVPEGTGVEIETLPLLATVRLD